MLPDEIQRLAFRYQAIRTPVPDEAAIHHAAGQAAFVDDLPDLAGTLHLAVGFAPSAAGHITRVDLDAVRAARDVVLALTAADIPAVNDASPGRTHDDPILAAEDIDHHRQPVFAVIARSRKAAVDATALGRVATASSLPTTDLDDALAANASLLADYGIIRGEPAEEIQRCDRKLIGQLRAGSQEHFPLEPQVALAIPAEGGALTILTSCEDPAHVQRVVAEMLDVSLSAVTVETRRVGGGFGGRRSQAVHWAALAALAAWRSGRPCKLRLDHADGTAAGGKRQALKVDYAAGVTEAGVINAVDVTFAARSGSGVDQSVESNDRIVLAADSAYYFPALRIMSRRMRSNNAPGGVIRGGGLLEGALFAERLMDHIAVLLNRDPLDIRKANLYAPGRDRTPYGTTVDDNILVPLVGELERTAEYRRRRREAERFNRTSPILKKGIALVPLKSGIRPSSPLGNQALTLIAIQPDGTIRLDLAAVETGQGLSTRATQIVAEELGVRHQEVRIGFASTTRAAALPAPTADTVLLSVVDACRAIKDRLYDFVEQSMRVDRERVEFREGRVRLGVRAFDFAEFMGLALAAHVPLVATGSHADATVDWDRTRAVGRPFHYFAYGASCAEVTVDIMTGEHRIDRIDVLQDAGRSLNPALDVGLIEGGLAFGLGWLTSEELIWDSTGKLTTASAADYMIPTVASIPSDFRVGFYQSAGAKEETPFRSKDIGDAAVPLALSVFCAIGDAIASLKPGTMPRLHVPATPEAVMRAIRALTGE